MGIEIERKFLVTSDEWMHAEPVLYSQGYLNREPARTVRIRISGETALLTIKSLTNNMTRQEFEYEVPLADAQQMMSFCEQPLIEKKRRVVPFAGMNWEVDEFLGENHGLVVAEIELESESQAFEKPNWLGDEVTSDARYFNSSLSKRPYSTW